VQLEIHAASWLGFAPDQNAKPLKFARQAFSKGSDVLRLEVGPVEHGVRMRLSAEEGYIRLIGLLLADGFDNRRPF
jgi:hypothetical protein